MSDAPRLLVAVDRARCIGSGLCARTAPADLVLGPDGRSAPARPDSEPSEELTEAAEMCPVEAITVRDAATGELVAPVW
ncbi:MULTISPECIES: ferredoxin [Kitasatospora]|uniref:Ferredoxin n=1 Tax=Kitasatospora setae (strain ATCC 33774 / DSM 43861 / JCM 3304 / KCC A-0304 / NBRC 14216 / KM-6054) TaxID=452652 RepID=E4N4E3_KITSK|nr:ferredoxin [Kitasatospora setae]BAJ26074.1 putative 3Fe-4S ferredoxin [Kitasatospora setae KM-6054]